MTLDNPTAFPHEEKMSDGSHWHSHEGMTLRDWFAGQWIAGTAGRDTFDPGQSTPEQRARLAYIEADAMLAARKSGQPS